MHASRRLLLFSLTVCWACTGDPTEASGPSLQVASDSAVYTRTNVRDVVARLTLQHNGGRAVALTGCPQPPALYVERATATGWEEAYSSGIVCLAIHSPSTIALRAASSLTFDVHATQPGRYRVRVFIGPDNAAPDGSVVSNEFEVR